MLETGATFSILQHPGTFPTFYGFPVITLSGSVITVRRSSYDKALSCQEIRNHESQWPWGIPASLPFRFSWWILAPTISWVHHLAEKKKSVGSLNVAKGHVQSEVLRLSYNMRGILEPCSKTQDHFRALRVFKLCGSSVGPEGHKPWQFCHRSLAIASLVCLR